MTWWLWTLLGLVLLTLEVVAVGGFYLMFFGAGAMLVGMLVGAGFGGPAWLQWLLFSVLSLATLITLRRPLMEKLTPRGSAGHVESFIGETAIVLEDFPAGGPGKVELRGSTWSAKSVASAPLRLGQRCRVERVEGLTLWIRPE